VTVEQTADFYRDSHAAVVTVADRRGEEEVSGLLKAGKGAEVVDAALHVAVAGFPVVGAGALCPQDRVCGEEAG
jgi:hypothetical protein